MAWEAVAKSAGNSADGFRRRLHRLEVLYRRFIPFLKPYRGKIALVYVCLLASLAVVLARPWPMKVIFDSVLLKHPLPTTLQGLNSLVQTNPYALLAILSAGLVTIIVVESFLSYVHRYWHSAIAQGVTNDIRLAVFEHLQTLSAIPVGSQRTGDLIVRLTSDIRSLRVLLVNHVQQLVQSMVSMLATLAVMLWIDFRITLVALVIVPPLFVLSYYFTTNMRAAVKEKREREGGLASVAEEVVTSIASVQANTREDLEKARFAEENDQDLQASLRGIRLSTAFGRLIRILNAGGAGLVLWYGAVRVMAGQLSPGDLLVLTTYVRDLYAPIDNLATLLLGINECSVSGERILELMESEAHVRDAPGAIPAPPIRGEVRFENVTFGYTQQEPVLKDVSFTVRPGQLVALVGSSGTGKSTVVNLLLRFMDPWQGRILIDGHDIREFTVKSLRSQMSVMLQEPALFRRSVSENIAYGKPTAEFEEIVAAAEAAKAHNFILNLPKGYETVLQERGGNLSGGEKQRIGLARALLRNAPIVILDEPVTRLDAETETEIVENLEPLFEGKTRFVIAHKFSTIKKADLILVMSNGGIVEYGTHEELLSLKGVYGRLYELQYG